MQDFKSFKDFYPYYLNEHAHPICRALHFIGSLGVLILLLTALITRNAWWLCAISFVGYGFAWLGHFGFEKNKPATFRYPLYSLMGDWVMFKDVLTGRLLKNKAT